MSYFLLTCFLWILTEVCCFQTRTVQAARCHFDWNITNFQHQNPKVVWAGDGDGNVTVTLKASCSHSSCSQSSATANFLENSVELKPWGNNTKYEVEVSFNCPYSNRKTRRKRAWRPPTIPGVPFNIHAYPMNTSIFMEWNAPEPFDSPILNYTVWCNRCPKLERNTTENYINILDLQPYKKYKVKVRAYTAFGSGGWSLEGITKTKIGVPSVPLNFGLKSFPRDKVAKLQWNHPLHPNAPDVMYKAMWKMSSSTKEIECEYTEKLIPRKRKVKHVISHLSPYTNYSARVSAITDAGQGPWTTFITFRTAVGVPNEPANLKATNISAESFTLSWEEPFPSTGPIQLYILDWCELIECIKGGVINTTDTSYFFEGLSPLRKYNVKLQAQTLAGKGAIADIDVKTLLGDPPHIELVGTKNTSFSVYWTPSWDYRGPYPIYYLRWKSTGSSYSTKIFDDPYAENRFTITGLDPFTKYEVQVRGRNRAGDGRWSKALHIQTDVGVPNPAVFQVIKPLDGRRVRIDWLTNGQYPGPLRYLLRARNIPGVCSDHTKEYQARGVKGTLSRNLWSELHTDIVTGLDPFGRYWFEIILITSATSGVLSNKSNEIQTAPEAAEEPMNMTADCRFSSTETRVSWMPPKKPNGIIFSYVVEYAMENVNFSEEIRVVNMCEGQSLLLSGLRPERSIDIRVYAKVKGVQTNGRPARLKRECILPAGVPYVRDTSLVRANSSGPNHLVLEWNEDVFSDNMGRLVRYSVLVGRVQSLGHATSGKFAENGPTWSNFRTGISSFYQATPMQWNPFNGGPDPLKCVSFKEWKSDSNKTGLRCSIGVQIYCLDNDIYCNGPLEPDTEYEIKIRGFTEGGYSETEPILIRTDRAHNNVILGTIIVIVALLFLGLLARGGYALEKKGYLDPLAQTIQSRINQILRCRASSLTPSEQEMKLYPTTRPIKIKDFDEHLRIMMSDSHLKLSQEFEMLKKKSPQLPCTVAEMDENSSKNRCTNLLPFDHSRVKLLTLCDEPGSDFINANYIPGFSSHREYIGSQGPLPNTVDDFWRMIWEQSVSMVVMLTQCIERDMRAYKKKCEQYWPDSGETIHYGDLRVTYVSESILPSHVVRIFHVQLESNERLIKQMQFTHWPDFGCPDSPKFLTKFVKAVRDQFSMEETVPILVHCSAGFGRTGTFIAVDRLSQQLLASPIYPAKHTIDIYGTVLQLRNYRTNMVQTEDQYIYIHLCVKELIQERDAPQKRVFKDLFRLP